MLLTTAVISSLHNKQEGKFSFAQTSAYLDAQKTSTLPHDSHAEIRNTATKTKLSTQRKRVTSFSLLKAVVSLLAAFFIVFTGTLSVTAMLYKDSLVASADDEEFDYDQEARDALDSAKPSDLDTSTEGFLEQIEMMQQGDDPDYNADGDGWGAVLSRVLLPGQYMNDTRQALNPRDRPIPVRENTVDQICNANGTPVYHDEDGNPSGNHGDAGQPTYHNCDIPNVITGSLQDIVSIVSNTGIRGGNLESATSMWGIGVTDAIPDGEVPVRDSERLEKYTALELYGYNLGWTRYNGEWDHIKVMTESRLLANYGVLDTLALSVGTIWNSLSQGIAAGASAALDELTSGNPLTAPFRAGWTFITTTVSETVQVGVRTVLDTSDWNTVYTDGWHRQGYGGTLYGDNSGDTTVRELSLVEVAEEMENIYVAESAAIVQGIVDEFNAAITDEQFLALEPDWEANPSPRIFGEQEDVDYASEEEFENWKDWFNEEEPELLAKAQETPSGDNRTAIIDDIDSYDSFADLQSDWLENYLAEMVTRAASAMQEQDSGLLSFFRSEDLFAAMILEALQENMRQQHNVNSPTGRLVCEHPSGGRDFLFENNNAAGVPSINPACNITEVRPPIQDGLFGNGYGEFTDSRNPDGGAPDPDTRRLAFEGVASSLISFEGIGNAIASKTFDVTITLTQMSNFLISLMYSPLLKTLGVDEIIVGMIEGFRDSLFFPLSILMVLIGGLSLLYKLIRGQIRDGFVSIILMFVVFVSGVVAMMRPETTMQLAEDIPAYLEQGLAAAVFSTGNSENDNICIATNTAPASFEEGSNFLEVEDEAYTSFDGEDSFNPRNSMRQMMCEIWRTYAFSPYVYGQFGTSYGELYANGYGGSSDGSFDNDNTALVGNAEVNMGGGTTVNNWALYQLDATTTGTTTNEDSTRPVGTLDNNIYRLVDLQAGPNLAERSDARYFDSWTGKNVGERLRISFFSIFSAGIGLVAIFLYVILGLEYTLLTTVMLLFLPIMFLIGLEPNQGRRILKTYLLTLLSLMIKRVVVALALAVMIRILGEVGEVGAAGAEGYFGIAVLSIIVTLFFISFRKQFMRWVTDATENWAGGQLMGGSGSNADDAHLLRRGWRMATDNPMGRTIKDTGRGAVSGAAGGFIGGLTARDAQGNKLKGTQRLKNAVSSISSGARDNAAEEYYRTSQVLRSSTMPKGLRGAFQTVNVVKNAQEWDDLRGTNDEAARLFADQASYEEGDYDAIADRAHQNFGVTELEDKSYKSRRAVRKLQKQLDNQEKQEIKDIAAKNRERVKEGREPLAIDQMPDLRRPSIDNRFRDADLEDIALASEDYREALARTNEDATALEVNYDDQSYRDYKDVMDDAENAGEQVPFESYEDYKEHVGFSNVHKRYDSHVMKNGDKIAHDNNGKYIYHADYSGDLRGDNNAETAENIVDNAKSRNFTASTAEKQDEGEVVGKPEQVINITDESTGATVTLTGNSDGEWTLKDSDGNTETSSDINMLVDSTYNNFGDIAHEKRVQDSDMTEKDENHGKNAEQVYREELESAVENAYGTEVDKHEQVMKAVLGDNKKLQKRMKNIGQKQSQARDKRIKQNNKAISEISKYANVSDGVLKEVRNEEEARAYAQARIRDYGTAKSKGEREDGESTASFGYISKKRAQRYEDAIVERWKNVKRTESRGYQGKKRD